jgi:hypothetical protein
MIAELSGCGDGRQRPGGKASSFRRLGGDRCDPLSWWNLNATTGGQSEGSQELQGIETERRANDAQRRENEQLLKLLKLAQDDPEQLLATPGSLLRSQPAVSRLKDALVDAQVYSANLLGSRSQKHPFVIAAR